MSIQPGDIVVCEPIMAQREPTYFYVESYDQAQDTDQSLSAPVLIKIFPDYNQGHLLLRILPAESLMVIGHIDLVEVIGRHPNETGHIFNELEDQLIRRIIEQDVLKRNGTVHYIKKDPIVN